MKGVKKREKTKIGERERRGNDSKKMWAWCAVKDKGEKKKGLQNQGPARMEEWRQHIKAVWVGEGKARGERKLRTSGSMFAKGEEIAQKSQMHPKDVMIEQQIEFMYIVPTQHRKLKPGAIKDRKKSCQRQGTGVAAGERPAS